MAMIPSTADEFRGKLPELNRLADEILQARKVGGLLLLAEALAAHPFVCGAAATEFLGTGNGNGASHVVFYMRPDSETEPFPAFSVFRILMMEEARSWPPQGNPYFDQGIDSGAVHAAMESLDQASASLFGRLSEDEADRVRERGFIALSAVEAAPLARLLGLPELAALAETAQLAAGTAPGRPGARAAL